MNESKGEIREGRVETENEAGGTPPSGGPPDASMGGVDNTTAENVEEAKEAAEFKRKRG